MCLHCLTSLKTTLEKLKTDKEGYVKAWKLFSEYIRRKNADSYYIGKNTTRVRQRGIKVSSYRSEETYLPYYHSFLRKKDAINFAGSSSEKQLPWNYEIRPVKVKKSWITVTGKQFDYNVIVSKHIVIEE